MPKHPLAGMALPAETLAVAAVAAVIAGATAHVGLDLGAEGIVLDGATRVLLGQGPNAGYATPEAGIDRLMAAWMAQRGISVAAGRDLWWLLRVLAATALFVAGRPAFGPVGAALPAFLLVLAPGPWSRADEALLLALPLAWTGFATRRAPRLPRRGPRGTDAIFSLARGSLPVLPLGLGLCAGLALSVRLVTGGVVLLATAAFVTLEARRGRHRARALGAYALGLVPFVALAAVLVIQRAQVLEAGSIETLAGDLVRLRDRLSAMVTARGGAVPLPGGEGATRVLLVADLAAAFVAFAVLPVLATFLPRDDGDPPVVVRLAGKLGLAALAPLPFQSDLTQVLVTMAPAWLLVPWALGWAGTSGEERVLVRVRSAVLAAAWSVGILAHPLPEVGGPTVGVGVDLVALRAPRAGGIAVPRGQAKEVGDILAWIGRCSEAGSPVLVAGSGPMLQFLTGRPNPLGASTLGPEIPMTQVARARLASAAASTSTEVVVLDLGSLDSLGERHPDLLAWIASAFRVDAEVGDHRLLARRGSVCGRVRPAGAPAETAPATVPAGGTEGDPHPSAPGPTSETAPP